MTNKPDDTGTVILGVHAENPIGIGFNKPKGYLVPLFRKVVLDEFITHIITTAKQSRLEQKYANRKCHSLIVLPFVMVGGTKF